MHVCVFGLTPNPNLNPQELLRSTDGPTDAAWGCELELYLYMELCIYSYIYIHVCVFGLTPSRNLNPQELLRSTDGPTDAAWGCELELYLYMELSIYSYIYIYIYTCMCVRANP